MRRLNNGHYVENGVEYMTTWSYKKTFGGDASTAANTADTQAIHRNYERTGLHCISEIGHPIEIDLHRVSVLRCFYGQNYKCSDEFGSETVGESCLEPDEIFPNYAQ